MTTIALDLIIRMKSFPVRMPQLSQGNMSSEQNDHNEAIQPNERNEPSVPMQVESEDVPLPQLRSNATLPPAEDHEPARPFKWAKGDRVADILVNNAELTESDRAVMAAIVLAETDSLGACKAFEDISKADKDSYMPRYTGYRTG